jgi:hypothetical protein
VEYNCALIKVDLLAACIALKVVGACIRRFPPAFGVKFAQSPSPWEATQGLIPEEMSQTLLTN